MRRKPKIQDQGDASVQRSLARLLLCNQIRELAEYPTPVMVTHLSRTRGLLASIAKLAYGSGGLSPPRAGVWRRVLIYPPVIVFLRLLLYWLNSRWGKLTLPDSPGFEHQGYFYPDSRIIRLAILNTIDVVYRKMRYYESSSSEITGYVTSTDKEEPLIRACLLLRAMRRYGVCIEFLIQRFNSGLPAAETRYWLSFFLREIGDTKAASMISPLPSRPEATDAAFSLNTPEQLSSAGSKSSRLKYGIIITTMFDSDVFRSSVLSLLGSDFRGEIVVVEDGNQPERVCESFCKRLPVKYVKNTKWSGLSATINLGIEQLAPETDIVIWAHNDILWPPHWFSQLNNAWERVYDLDKVETINLGHIIFPRWWTEAVWWTDAALCELFVRGRYEDLVWILRAMRGLPHALALVQDVQIKDMGRLFGLARNLSVDNLVKLRMMIEKFSVGASFTLQTWRELGGFDPDISFGFDLELHYHGFYNRKWNLWINNTPLIHMWGGDVGSLTHDNLMSTIQKITETNKAFQEKYGWEAYHFSYTYFAETAIIYHDEIVNAANELRFSDIDFVFDDFWERLKRKRLESCELVWCPSRTTCQYL